MKFLRELLEVHVADKDEPEVDKDEPEETDDVQPDEEDTDEDTNEEYAEDDDIESVYERQGYEKEKTEMRAFGAMRPVTILSKTEDVDGMQVDTQYLINPKTGAWVYKIAKQGSDDFIDIKNGEDPNSLLKHLKHKIKVTPKQVSVYFG